MRRIPQVDTAHNVGRRIVLGLALVGTAVFLLVGCQGTPSGFSGGETLTPEMLREISASIFSDPAEPDTQPLISDPVLLAYSGEVFWVDGGSVVHTGRDCSHIRRATEIRSGSVTDAAAAGKIALCATCRKHMNGTDTDTEFSFSSP